MKRMWSKEELEAIAEEYGLTTEQVNGIIDDYFTENFENIMSGWLSANVTEIDDIIAAYLSENPQKKYLHFVKFLAVSPPINIEGYVNVLCSYSIPLNTTLFAEVLDTKTAMANGIVSNSGNTYPIISIKRSSGTYTISYVNNDIVDSVPAYLSTLEDIGIF